MRKFAPANGPGRRLAPGPRSLLHKQSPSPAYSDPRNSLPCGLPTPACEFVLSAVPIEPHLRVFFPIKTSRRCVSKNRGDTLRKSRMKTHQERPEAPGRNPTTLPASHHFPPSSGSTRLQPLRRSPKRNLMDRYVSDVETSIVTIFVNDEVLQGIENKQTWSPNDPPRAPKSNLGAAPEGAPPTIHPPTNIVEAPLLESTSSSGPVPTLSTRMFPERWGFGVHTEEGIEAGKREV